MIKLPGDIWKRWEAKHTELQAKERWNLAGLFRGVEGPGFRKARQKILYVGKATAGPYNPGPQDNGYFNCNHGMFWSFARRLSGLTGGNPAVLENIAWTNLCKIGTERGNPKENLVEAQTHLAVETLRLEFVELKPTLVVCVAEGFADNLVYDALGVSQGLGDAIEEVSISHLHLYRRPAIGDMPALLWMKHPQGTPRDYRHAAEAMAAEMLAS